MPYSFCFSFANRASECFNQRRLPPPPPVRSASNAVVKHNPKSAKVNMMNVAQAEDSLELIMGNLPVNDIPTRVSFDTGASLSFISKPFASMHDLHTVDLPTPIADSSPVCS